MKAKRLSLCVILTLAGLVLPVFADCATAQEGIIVPRATSSSVAAARAPESPPARKKAGPWFNWKIWTPIMAAQAADILTTRYALRSNALAREANPLLFGGHDGALAVKLGVATLISIGLSKGMPEHPKLCIGGTIGITAGTMVVAANNYRAANGGWR